MIGGRVVTALLFTVLAVTGCSGSGAEPAPTTTAPKLSVDPPIPAGANQLPYQLGDSVALHSWIIRVVDVQLPWSDATAAQSDGDQLVAVEIEVTNGELESQTLEPAAFVAYDLRLQGVAPEVGPGYPGFAEPIASGATETSTLVFRLPPDEQPTALVFNGSKYYGAQGGLDGLIALDADWTPPPGDA